MVRNCDIASSWGTKNLVLSRTGNCVSLGNLSTITYEKIHKLDNRQNFRLIAVKKNKIFIHFQNYFNEETTILNIFHH